MNRSGTLAWLQNALSPIAGDFAAPEAERILTFLLGISRSDLYLGGNSELPGHLVEKIDAIIARRLTAEPLPYILGSAYFFDREIAVTSDVLIPRLDTETLVETVLANEDSKSKCFLDFGTGSGCISAALAGNRPWRAVAVDASRPSLRIARINCGTGADLICGNNFAALKSGRFDFLVSNPPYIPSAAIAELDRSVRDFEPHQALDGGADGLEFYRYFAASAERLLKPGGGIYCEIGYDQGESVTEILVSGGWKNIRIVKDLGGRDRVVYGKMGSD